MLEKQSKQKQIKRYMVVLFVLSFAIFLLDYDERVLPYNSTILAFSYKYGLISRGLIGTIYQWIDGILPVDMLTYEAVLYFTLIVTLLFYGLFFWFCYRCLQSCNRAILEHVQYMLLFYAVFVISMFAYKRNFGRLDIYLMAVTLIGTLLIIRGKLEWLIVPLAVLAVMFHQGYVFMYYNVFLALLVYRFFSAEEKKKRQYYGIILIISFVAVSGLFLWFEFFSHTDGARHVDEIIENATRMTKPFNGMTYHDTLIDHEIMGVDLSDVEFPYRVMNWMELPVFLLILSPYLVLGFRLFRGMIGAAGSRRERRKYLFAAIAAGTMLPLFLMKVDYGRWFFALISYYAIVILAFLAMGDEIVEAQVAALVESVRKKTPAAALLLCLPALLTPFWDVHINGLMRGWSNPINEMFLHLW